MPSFPPRALAAALLLAASAAQPSCFAGMMWGDVRDETEYVQPPPSAPGARAQSCALLCHADLNCGAFVFYKQGGGRFPCPFPRGCCHFKPASALATMLNSSYDKDACGAVMRHAPSSYPPPPPPASPPVGAKNVLHIIVDDLRPDLAPFGPAFMHTPHLSALASESTLFSRAYCNIAVCSPSRLSFLTGRRPATSRTFNFINHFRQSNCIELKDTAIDVAAYVTININYGYGGAGQCCSHCQADGNCAAWSLLADGRSCELKASAGGAHTHAPGVISGLRGSTKSREWTTLPQTFLNAGYNVYGSGKVFHTEEGGNGPLPWDGQGMPPLQDAPSWSRVPNATSGDVNAIAPMYAGCCGEPGDADGNTLDNVTNPFADKVIGALGISLLKELGAQRASGGAPFYLAVGFRKPHLPFRHPDFYDALYAPQSSIATARYDTLDVSVPPIAFHSCDPIASPYEPVEKSVAQAYRFNYYASISWIDHQVGAILSALDATGLANDTLVIFHSDHAWSLGEHGEWQVRWGVCVWEGVCWLCAAVRLHPSLNPPLHPSFRSSPTGSTARACRSSSARHG